MIFFFICWWSYFSVLICHCSDWHRFSNLKLVCIPGINLKLCVFFFMSFDFVCSLFSYLSFIFKKWKIVVLFSDPFTFLTLCVHLQDFCIFLFPITRTCCSFSEDCFACRLIERTLPTGSERQKSLGVYISLKWLLNQWVGGSLKALTPSPQIKAILSSPRDQSGATLWGTLLEITPLLLPSLLCSTSSILFLFPLGELSL